MYAPRILLVLPVLLVVAAPATAQTPAFTASTVASLDGARGIATADFDRNGWIDVALASGTRNSVSILLNDRGTLRHARDVAVGRGPFALVAADFNRDGAPDLLATNADGASFSFLRGHGDGTFTAQTFLEPSTNFRGAAAADIDGDGWSDVVLTDYANGSVRWRRGLPGGFGGGTGFQFGSRAQGVAAADFNHDGRTDLAVAYDSSTDGGVGVVLGNGGTAWTLSTMLRNAGAMNLIATADLNMDGWTDLVAASTGNNRLALFVGGFGGDMRFVLTLPTGSSPRDIAVADINGDGWSDVVTANYAANSVSVFLGNGKPTLLTAAATVPAGAGSRALALADFDRDGLTDVTVGDQSQAAATLLRNRTAVMPAGFAYRPRRLGGESFGSGSGDAVFTGNFDNDGLTDVVTGGDFPQMGLVWTPGNGFSRPFPLLLGRNVQLAGVNDVNRDGHDDIIALEGSRPTKVLVLLGNGFGQFTTVDAASIADSVTGLRFADVTRDGLIDVIYSYSVFRTGPQAFVTMPGRGDGTFAGRLTTAQSQPETLLAVEDLDRDGALDLVSMPDTNTLAIWHGTGTGTFVAAGRVTSPRHGGVVVAGDLNHDGFVDLVVGGSDSVSVLLGSAAGLSWDHYVMQEPSVTGGPFRLALADLNLDGDLDLAVDNGQIRFGDGRGDFGAAQRFDYYSSGTILVADVDRNGVPDILSTPMTGIVVILLGVRTDVNLAPDVTMNDVTFSYEQQFIENEMGPDGVSATADAHDPDAHALQYVWRDASGAVVSTQRYINFAFDHPLLPGTYHYEVTVSDGRGGSTARPFTVTVMAFKEIVLHAASGSGAWEILEDPTAASQQRVHDPNLGRPKVTTPQTGAVGTFSIPFVADPTQTYKLWVRLKADRNDYANDSLWMQISGAVDTAGRRYEPGTTSGLAINLEECPGCGISGWGWEDDGWGAVNRNGVLLRFPEGGGHRIVIQTREDGVSIDQIVLSAEKYVGTRPGTAKNDDTILAPTWWQASN